ncbi:hypothetical protein NTD84_28655 [Pseudomonas sp. 14P_8.1_Bac3]|uniref:hypothetical protein n=1 Tax=Pseudomonas sp. 14P_8.1_Bac3 TaxID=2971621 RepID=UPI0021C66DF8|nr:hypothetical protein [Pseudomonas sp. 14P_8.1_Bac3]MCU1763671.1 hypothetical protein [Pseudomonas sp. 14P_8.1_Bac3]
MLGDMFCKIGILINKCAMRITGQDVSKEHFAVDQQPVIKHPLLGQVSKWRAVPSSKFLSYVGQLNAYNEAMTREARNMSRFTGEDRKGNLVVRMEAENIGSGYEPNALDPANPRYIPKMNAFEMKFDFETLEPLAFYPIEKV